LSAHRSTTEHPLSVAERRSANIEAAGTSAFRNLAGGAFLIPFAIAVGAGPIHIGLIGAGPFIGRAIQLLLRGWIAGKGARNATLWAGFGERLVFAAAISGALLLMDTGWSPWFLVVGFVLCSVAAELFNVAIAVWLAERVAVPVFGRFNAQRTVWAHAAGVSVLVGVALLLFTLGVDTRKAVAAGAIILAGAAIGMLVLLRLRMIPALPSPVRVPERTSLRQSLRLTLADERFRRFLAFAAIWNAAVMLASPFFMAYAVARMGFGVLHTSGIAAVHLGAGAALLPFWGRIVDRYGNKPVLLACGFWASLVPLAWLALAEAGLPYGIFLAEALSGSAWAAVNLCMANIAIKMAPRENRVAYISVYAAVIGVVVAPAPVLGGVLISTLNALGHDGFAGLMIVSATLRLLTLGLGRRFPEPGAKKLSRSTRALSRVGFGWASPAAFGTAMLAIPLWMDNARRQVQSAAMEGGQKALSLPIRVGSPHLRRIRDRKRGDFGPDDRSR
jgi:MFS family permease